MCYLFLLYFLIYYILIIIIYTFTFSLKFILAIFKLFILFEYFLHFENSNQLQFLIFIFCFEKGLYMYIYIKHGYIFALKRLWKYVIGYYIKKTWFFVLPSQRSPSVQNQTGQRPKGNGSPSILLNIQLHPTSINFYVWYQNFTTSIVNLFFVCWFHVCRRLKWISSLLDSQSLICNLL